MKYFKSLIERSDVSLVSHTHLAQYIPKIESREFSLLKSEVRDNFLSIAFDGTTRLGEAVNITSRWMSSDFQLVKRLLRFTTTKLHLKGPQLASLITRCICTELGMDPEKVVAFSRDSVLVNGSACRILCESPFEASEDLLCICHTCNNVGERLAFDVLSAFMTPWLELVGGRDAHAGARSLWRAAVAPQTVPGFSNVRWYSKAEIQFVLAENFHKIQPFLQDLDAHKYGDATRKKLHSFFDDPAQAKMLRLQLAAMLDFRPVVKTTYELEGDRLEILLVYERIERLRALGRAMANDGAKGVLPNVDAALRNTIQLQRGVEVEKLFPGFGVFRGQIESSDTVESTLYPGQERRAYTVRYPSDGTTEDLEEEEVRPLIYTLGLDERKQIINSLLPAFEYLESRIQGTCQAQYSCQHMYDVCRVLRIFDPTYAARHLTADGVTELAIVKPIAIHVRIDELQGELPVYLSMAMAEEFARDDVDMYTECVLKFWRRTPLQGMSAWRKAARIAFSMSPNSASCERIFSMLKSLWVIINNQF